MLVVRHMHPISKDQLKFEINCKNRFGFPKFLILICFNEFILCTLCSMWANGVCWDAGERSGCWIPRGRSGWQRRINAHCLRCA